MYQGIVSNKQKETIDQHFRQGLVRAAISLNRGDTAEASKEATELSQNSIIRRKPNQEYLKDYVDRL